MVLMKRGKGRKALNWSLSLGQMEFGVDEQVKIFTEFVYIFCKRRLTFTSQLADTKTPVLLVHPNTTLVERKELWRGELGIRPGGFPKTSLCLVYESCGKWISPHSRPSD